MFIASMILTVVFMLWVFSWSGWNPMNILDISSAIVVFGIAVIVLFGTGLFKDFNHAFKIAYHDKKDYRLTDIKKSMFAVKLSIVSAMINGCMATLFHLFMHGRMTNWSPEFVDEFHMVLELLGGYIAISILPLFYASVFALLLLPVYGVLKRRSIEYMGDE